MLVALKRKVLNVDSNTDNSATTPIAVVGGKIYSIFMI